MRQVVGGRPRGEIRQVLASTAQRLADEHGAFTWRDVAEAAQVGYCAARATVLNMARAGELQPVGAAKRAHSRRWMTLYAPAACAIEADADLTPAGALPLADAVMAWRS